MTLKMENMRSWLQSTSEYLKVKERSGVAVAFAKERPVAATLIGVALVTSFLPAVAFVSFVATFLIVGVVTLLIIEGTAVVSAIVILLFALFGSMVASVFIGLLLLTGLFVGRFMWRATAPLRTEVAKRLGLCNGSTKTAASEPEEKGQMETNAAPDLGYAGNMTYEEESD